MVRIPRSVPKRPKKNPASRKFIPDSDREFAAMARTFAHTIERDPARYMVGARDAEIISEAVNAFRDALAASLRKLTKSKLTVMKKDAAREKSEKIVRRYARLIRANEAISRIDKQAIFVRERPRRLRRRACPHEPPYLRFLRVKGMKHVLEFLPELAGGTRAKPFGAVRLELFVGLCEPREPIPARPDARSASCGHFRGWYLRSFTKNPIEVEYPVSPDGKPMLVVYWGRWASTTGEVGPWSETVVGRIEGNVRA